jgi:putative holliday junction resolvase
LSNFSKPNDDSLLPELIVTQIGDAWPGSGRIIGIDYGTVRIGLSICDPSRTWISPLTTYTRRNEALDTKYFEELVKLENPTCWVIGLPIHCDGRESQKSVEAREFANWLHDLTGLSIRFFDERYSSKLADRLLNEAQLTKKQRKNRIDRVAAHLILEHFLEYDRNKRQA